GAFARRRSEPKPISPTTQPSATSSHGREEGGRAFTGDCPMSEVTPLPDALPPGDAAAAAQLLPLVYDDLRRLAHEAPGQTLHPGGLARGAYLRVVGAGAEPGGDTRGLFSAAAAEAMGRILVENARRKRARKHGGLARQFLIAFLIALLIDLAVV